MLAETAWRTRAGCRAISILVFHRALPDLQRMKHKPDQAFGHRQVFCFFLVFHRALPDLQRVKHKPDQAFGHRQVFCFFLGACGQWLTRGTVEQHAFGERIRYPPSDARLPSRTLHRMVQGEGRDDAGRLLPHRRRWLEGRDVSLDRDRQEGQGEGQGLDLRPHPQAPHRRRYYAKEQAAKLVLAVSLVQVTPEAKTVEAVRAKRAEKIRIKKLKGRRNFI